VYGVYFEAGDPDVDGEGWNFTRNFEDDDGVCTVREVQQATFYDEIQELRLSRTRLVCVFEPAVVHQAGCGRLEIHLDVDDETWREVSTMMDLVCSDRPFYRRT
jgi:hypothetical protein